MVWIAQPHRFAVLALAAAVQTTGCSGPGPFISRVDRLAKLPALTNARSLTGTERIAAVEQQRCVLLTSRREIAAPVAYTEGGDVKNAAALIDHAVGSDGGNAYWVSDYVWVPGMSGEYLATQLRVQFDTFLCEENLDEQPASTTDDPMT